MTTISRKSFLRALLSGLAGLPLVAKALGRGKAVPRLLKPTGFESLPGFPASGWTKLTDRAWVTMPKEWIDTKPLSVYAENLIRELDRRTDKIILNALEAKSNSNEDDEQKTIL